VGFKDNLKAQLHYVDMPVKELAIRTGIKKKTIDTYLGARSCNPSAESAVLIADALGVTVEFLINGQQGEKLRPLSSFPKDIQSVVKVMEKLDIRDRKLLLALVEAMKEGKAG
jgi:transcriptional regulator with XRE-family HTH domain